MRQLALDLQLADYARFDSFYAGPNQIVVEALRQAAGNRVAQVAWIWGAPGSGRSHLLQAAVAAAAEKNHACAWLPLSDTSAIAPGMLEGMGQLDLVCIDDIDVIAGQSRWELPLFGLFEALRENNARLIVTASASPANVVFELRDLASRLASGPTWKLKALDDADQLEALKLRAHWRGLELPDETGRYLLRRVERGNLALFALLDELDSAALTAQRRLTVPFVREVLGLKS